MAQHLLNFGLNLYYLPGKGWILVADTVLLACLELFVLKIVETDVDTLCL